jgi:hypothetical protein
MRMNAIAMMVALPALVMAGGVTAAVAADKPDVKGLYLLTDYPAVSVRPGTTSTISARRPGGLRRCSAAGSRWARPCRQPTRA